MLPIKKNGTYFIKDEELKDAAQDAFGHEDIANNIINIIDNKKSPFNIAIVGKWGLGKSSLIKFVSTYYSKKNEFIVEEINAWKYEKEALRRVFLKRILLKLNYHDNSMLNELLENINSINGNFSREKMSFWDKLKEWKDVLGISLSLYIVGLLIYSIFISFWNENVVANLKNNWFVYNGYFCSIFLVLLSKYIRAVKGRFNFKILTPIKSTDEYEEELKKLLDKSENKSKTIITIIDDLDRLTPEKIVEALDAIKAFVNYENCIFLVPFDDSILKKALDSKTLKFNNNEQFFIESELFLDKLFQYRIYLPNIIIKDLPQYAVELVKQEALDLVNLVKEDMIEKIIKEILIHKGVTTPRQVKKIINIFANNVLLAYRRIERNNSNALFVTENGIKLLAKISVLQADFSSFYKILFLKQGLIDDFLETVNIENIENVDPLIISYFDQRNKKVVLRNSTENLYNFLSRTSSIKGDLLPFLYMTQDRDSIIFGDELSKSLRNSLTSGSQTIVKRIFEDNKERDLTELLYNILMYSEPFEWKKSIQVLINLFGYYQVYEYNKIIDLTGQRLTDILKIEGEIKFDEINFKNLFYFYSSSAVPDGLNQAIVESLELETDEFVQKLSIFFKDEEKFSDEARNVVINYFEDKLGNDSKNSFEEVLVLESIDLDKYYTMYFSSLEMFNRLLKYIEDTEIDNENPLCKKCLDLFSLLVRSKTINEVLTSIYKYFSNGYFLNLFYKQILDNVKSINLSTGTELCTVLLKIKEEACDEKINMLLSKMVWGIDEKNNIDDYLVKYINNTVINDILINIVEQNQLELIPKTIEGINHTIFNNPIDFNTVKQIQKKYSREQNSQLFNLLRNKISPSNLISEEDFSAIIKFYEMFIEHGENHVYINDNLLNLFSQITQNSNNEILIKFLQLVDVTKNILSNDLVTKYISWASSYIASYPMMAIKILDILKEHIAKDHYTNIATSIMKCSNCDVLTHSLNVLRYTRTSFKEKDLLKNYKDFLIKSTEVSANRRETLKDMSDYFSTIGDVDELIIQIVQYDDLYDEAIKVSSKFVESTNNKEQVFLKVLVGVNNNKYEIVDKIFKRSIESYDNFINKMVENVNDQKDINFLVNLLGILVINFKKYNENIMKLISIIFKAVDVSLIGKIIDIIEPLPAIANKSIKREMGDLMYEAFRDINDLERKLKGNLYAFVLSHKISTAFLKDENGDKRVFSEDENDIMQSIVSMNK